MYMPPGFNTVTPYFFAKDADAFVRFLVEGLGGAETCRTMRSDGFFANVQVQLGTSTVMVSEAAGKYGPMASAYFSTSIARMHRCNARSSTARRSRRMSWTCRTATGRVVSGIDAETSGGSRSARWKNPIHRKSAPERRIEFPSWKAGESLIKCHSRERGNPFCVTKHGSPLGATLVVVRGDDRGGLNQRFPRISPRHSRRYSSPKDWCCWPWCARSRRCRSKC